MSPGIVAVWLHLKVAPQDEVALLVEVQSQHDVAFLVIAPPVSHYRLFAIEIESLEFSLKAVVDVFVVKFSIELGKKEVDLLSLQLFLLKAHQKAGVVTHPLEGHRLALQAHLREQFLVELQVDLEILVEGQALEDAVGPSGIACYLQEVGDVEEAEREAFRLDFSELLL